MNKILLAIILNSILSILNSFCFSQSSKTVSDRSQTTDSLLTVLFNTKKETEKVNTLNALFLEFEFTDEEKAKEYLNKALELSQKIDYKKGLAMSYTNLGFLAQDKSNCQQAEIYFMQSLKIAEGLSDKKIIAASLCNIGNVFFEQGDYPKALEFFLKALKISEESGNKQSIAAKLGNIGGVYISLRDFSKALEYYLKALKIDETLGDKNELSPDLNNIAIIYYNQKNYPKALEYCFKALKIDEELGNKNWIASRYGTLGTIYSDMGENQNLNTFKRDSLFNTASNYYLKALNVYQELDNKNGIAIQLDNIGILYVATKRYKEAEENFKKALAIETEIGTLAHTQNTLSHLADLYAQTNQPVKALEFYKQFIKVRDSIFNETKSKQITEMQTKYESEKKDKDLIQKEAELQKQQVEATQKALELNTFIIGFLLMVVFAGFIFRSLRITRKQRNIIVQQKEIVELQKVQVEEKNHEISSSISYAKRIQSSFLTSETYIKRHLSDYFILYKPRDVVSGDFYWMHQQGKYFYFCVADCTGHGIPGAFMSLIGMGILNEIINSKQISDTNNMLDELRRIVILALNPEGALEEGKDGMDLILGRLNLTSKELQYSAANNSFYVCRKGELTEYKPDKMPVGKFGEFEKPFTKHTIQLEDDDIIYAITDGYADQFGGPKGKKFKYKQLEDILISNSNQPMHLQSEILNKKLNDWKADLEQVDDITIVGIRL